MDDPVMLGGLVALGALGTAFLADDLSMSRGVRDLTESLRARMLEADNRLDMMDLALYLVAREGLPTIFTHPFTFFAQREYRELFDRALAYRCLTAQELYETYAPQASPRSANPVR